MRILVLTFYYEPDLCAGSFRAKAIVEQLSKDVPEGSRIDVITTYPNRYASFKVEARAAETLGNIHIERVRVPAHKSGMLDQLLSFLYYYRTALKRIDDKSYDLVFATSSRLFTAFLGARIARRKNLPLYLDIRDIFVETLSGVLPVWMAFSVTPLLRLVEHYTFRRARRINLVSEGFRDYFGSKYPAVEYDFFTNGIDEEFADFSASGDATGYPPQTGKKRVVYAGNIGESQGLHHIVPELARQTADEFEYIIIGDGGRRQQLEEELHQRRITNVRILDPMPRSDLHEYYRQADVLLLHLNSLPAYERVLPSKLFEYAATGKPVLAGVSGYCATFIRENVANSALFSPCNPPEGKLALGTLVLGNTDRKEFVSRFSRGAIVRQMSRLILGSSARENN